MKEIRKGRISEKVGNQEKVKKNEKKIRESEKKANKKK